MNTPNKLSLIRIITVPVMMFFYLATFIPFGKFIALGLFAFGAFTDFLDGYIARKYHLVTDLGKLLDPIGDKMLVTVALILLCCDFTIPAPYGVIALSITIARDLVINLIRQIASSKNVVVAANKLGKYKTLFQDISLILLMLFAGFVQIGVYHLVVEIIMWIGYGSLALATVFAILSIIAYIKQNSSVFKNSSK